MTCRIASRLGMRLKADLPCAALQSHGVLMAVVFVVILPVSVVIAATFKRPQGSNIWFQVHRTIGVSISGLDTQMIFEI